MNMIITPVLVILMIVVFTLTFLFVKTIDHRKWITIPLSLLLTPVIYFYVLYPMINIFSNYHHQKYFDSEAWKEKPALRYEMIGDMVDQNRLTGKTKSEVKSLLGKEEWLSWNDALKAHDENKWNYGLGMKPGALNETKECAEIVFENDTVVAINTYQEKLTFDAKEDTEQP